MRSFSRALSCFVHASRIGYYQGVSATYEVSTDPDRFDIDLIHRLLHTTYWARNMPRQLLEKSIRHSLCFGVYSREAQVAFARVITDLATFAYLSDVIVVPEHRGRGVSKLLMGAILGHPELQGLRRFVLATRDAHGLYAQFGFKPLAAPEEFMTIHNADGYAAAEDLR